MEYGGSYLCVCHTHHNVSHCEWGAGAGAGRSLGLGCCPEPRRRCLEEGGQGAQADQGLAAGPEGRHASASRALLRGARLARGPTPRGLSSQPDAPRRPHTLSSALPKPLASLSGHAPLLPVSARP